MGGRLSGISPTSWVTAQNVFKHLFAIGLFAIQAPMLGPRAFGLIALVMVFIGFCEQVLEIAAIDGLISVKDIDERHYSTMNAVNFSPQSLTFKTLNSFSRELYFDHLLQTSPPTMGDARMQSRRKSSSTDSTINWKVCHCCFLS